MVVALIAPAPASAGPGDLDPRFGSHGIEISASLDASGAVAANSDGSVYIAGEVADEAAIARFSGRGELDDSFGVDGVSRLSNGTFARDVAAIPPSGKVLILGVSDTGGFVAKLDPAGQLDPTFGTGGIRELNSRRVWHLARDSQGRIIVAGIDGVLRLLPNGTLDASWSPDGTGELPAGYVPDSVAIDSQDRVLVPGFVASSGYAVARVRESGDLDVAFGAGGVRELPVPLSLFSGSIDGAADSSDGVALAWVECSGVTGTCEARASRVTSSGQIDSRYPDQGVSAHGGHIVLDDGDRPVTAGLTNSPNPFFFADTGSVGRLHPDGSSDRHFGFRGNAYLYPRNTTVDIAGVDRGADRSIYVTGSAKGGPESVFIARLRDRARDDADGDGRVDRRDGCPVIAAERHRGCPRLGKRRVTISRAGRKLTGRVKADHRACSARVPVTLFRRTKGKDRRVVRTRTRSNGSWKADRRLRRAAYYAVARATTGHGRGSCKKVRSPTRR